MISILFIFLCCFYIYIGSAATFSRFIPLIKDRFDYGITIFILTFSFVSVSGYRVEHLVTMAQQRLSTISIGISICFCICIFICPVWAGGDLHFLIVRNMEKLATSLEGILILLDTLVCYLIYKTLVNFFSYFNIYKFYRTCG